MFETPLPDALCRAAVKAPRERGLDLIAALLVAGGLLLRWSAS